MNHLLAHPHTNLMKYSIHEIVDIGHTIQKLDPTLGIVWENIGDPVAKGWRVPPFLKDILQSE